MDSKNNGELLLFILMELDKQWLESSKIICEYSSVHFLESANTLQAVFTLDFFQKGIWGGRVEWPKQEWSQGGRARKLWDCDPTEPRSQFYIIPNRRAAQRALLLSVLALPYRFFDKSSWLLEAPTHFLHPDFFCVTDFPWKLPICLMLRVSPTEQWCTNDMMA